MRVSLIFVISWAKNVFTFKCDVIVKEVHNALPMDNQTKQFKSIVWQSDGTIALSSVQSFARMLIHNTILLINTPTMLGTKKGH